MYYVNQCYVFFYDGWVPRRLLFIYKIKQIIYCCTGGELLTHTGRVCEFKLQKLLRGRFINNRRKQLPE